MRLKILCEDRCEDIAIKIAAACVRSLRRTDRLRSLSDPQHVQFMLDVYIVLLHKLKRMQDLLAQVSLPIISSSLSSKFHLFILSQELSIDSTIFFKSCISSSSVSTVKINGTQRCA